LADILRVFKPMLEQHYARKFSNAVGLWQHARRYQDGEFAG